MSQVDATNMQAVPPPEIMLLQMISGFWVSHTIATAAKLGIADILKDGPKNSDELAKETQTHESSLYRLLRTLASFGIFTEVRPRTFALTPLGEHLRTDAPMSLRGMAMMFGEEWHWRPWGELLYSVQTGKPAFTHFMGAGNFEYFAQHPEAWQIFNNAMTSFAGQTIAALTTAYDFSQVESVIDVGGGQGTLLIALLTSYPKLTGALFDLPFVVEEAKSMIEGAGLAARCRMLAGSFFESIPGGYAVYLLRNIIHGLDEENALRVLNNCRSALGDTGKLLLVELVIPPGDEANFGKLLDLEMLVNSGGGERTAEEYRDLYAKAGLKLTRIIPTSTPFSLIEGVLA